MSVGELVERPRVLIPYDPKEAIDVQTAAMIAGRSATTIRGWCAQFHIGRRVVGGPWEVSRAALRMLLDGDENALRAYLSGDREGPLVSRYLAGD